MKDLHSEYLGGCWMVEGGLGRRERDVGGGVSGGGAVEGWGLWRGGGVCEGWRRGSLGITLGNCSLRIYLIQMSPVNSTVHETHFFF
jgi:hypothetical protein